MLIYNIGLSIMIRKSTPILENSDPSDTFLRKVAMWPLIRRMSALDLEEESALADKSPTPHCI